MFFLYLAYKFNAYKHEILETKKTAIGVTYGTRYI
jgi:hypothetical protein